MAKNISNCMVNKTCFGAEFNLTSITTSPPSTSNSGTSCLTSYCISLFIAISIISICGVLANGLVVVVISRNKKLHKPTFVAIAALSVSDLTFLFFRYIQSVVLTYFKDVSRAQYIFKLICDGGGLAAAGASIIHVVALSVLRYFILVHPLKSHTTITNIKIIYSSIIIWIVSTANGAFYLYFVVINLKSDPEAALVINTVITLIMSILPLVGILVFHTLKAKSLRKSIASCRKTTIRQMSRVITFVIVGYIVTTTPTSILDVIIIAGTDTKATWMVICRLVGRILLFLNFAINPFIYFVLSPQFRNSLRCGENKRRRTFASSQSAHYSSSQSSSLSQSDNTETMAISFVDNDGVTNNNTKL